jgi:hypothetical protein
MQEQLNEGLKSALKVLDDKDYQHVTNLVSAAKLVSDDIMDVSSSMRTKIKPINRPTVRVRAKILSAIKK